LIHDEGGWSVHALSTLLVVVKALEEYTNQFTHKTNRKLILKFLLSEISGFKKASLIPEEHIKMVTKPKIHMVLDH
jgi:hypothetical protein